jgi:hypothetical protein
MAMVSIISRVVAFMKGRGSKIRYMATASIFMPTEMCILVTSATVRNTVKGFI